MPRYFFMLVYPDRIIGDPRGTVVPSDEAAIGAARAIVDELLEDCGPVNPDRSSWLGMKRARSFINSSAIESRHAAPAAFRRRGTIDEHPESFIVRDATGFTLGYFYFDQEERAPHCGAHDERRGTADGGQLRQAAGAVA
jgi:hypothetical protein